VYDYLVKQWWVMEDNAKQIKPQEMDEDTLLAIERVKGHISISQAKLRNIYSFSEIHLAQAYSNAEKIAEEVQLRAGIPSSEYKKVSLLTLYSYSTYLQDLCNGLEYRTLSSKINEESCEDVKCGLRDISKNRVNYLADLICDYANIAANDPASILAKPDFVSKKINSDDFLVNGDDISELV
jgi:hypothetical protein